MIKLSALCIIILGSLFLLGAPYKAEQKITEPTVFIHGYKGTFYSFGFMLHRFENIYDIGNKVLVYYVAENGEIQEYFLNENTKKPPLIQVVFEDNRANLEDTAGWLAEVLYSLKNNYDTEKVNLVGHSMGGIVSLKYTLQYQSVDYPDVNKLVALGTPFAGIFSQEYFLLHHDPATEDLKPDAAALQLLEKGTFPENTHVLNIGSTGDAVADPESVQALDRYVPEAQIREIMIEDDEMGHSALHQREEIDKIISSFLWQDDAE
jgi:uncharacterized alpha/beta hydrolase family protein